MLFLSDKLKEVKRINKVNSYVANRLYLNIYEAVLVNTVAGVGLVFSVGKHELSRFEINWLIILFGLSFLRLIDGYFGRKSRDIDEHRAKFLVARFASGLLLSAVAWSVYIVYQVITGSDIQVAITIMVMATVISGSFIVISANEKLAISYPVIVLLPASIVGLLSEQPNINFLGSVTLIFVLVFFVAARKSARFTSTSLEVKSNNVMLLNKLNQFNAELEDKVNARTEEIYELSTIDPLTKLQNRNAFKLSLDGMIEEASGNPVSLLFIDLDGFKKINDTQGHELGDRILVLVANRLTTMMDSNNIVCRWGGDEFLFALSNQDSSQAQSFAKALISAISLPIYIEHKEFKIGASIGIAVYPDHGEHAWELIEHADVAMYHQKKTEIGKCRVFDEAIKSKLRREELLRQHLLTAEQRGDLFVYYQPIVNAVDKQIVSFEALMRLKLDDGMVSPEEFIPIAENHGFIGHLGNWILRRACMDAAKWQPIHEATVSVNVSVIQLLESNFCAIVEKALLASKLKPSSLHLEITESVFSQNTQIIREQVRTLRVMGIKVSIDDFGTGYSSLSQLQMLSVDCVKIDRTFVDNMQKGGRTIIDATLQIARALDYSTIAEGIETEEQLNALLDMGVVQFQGFYFSKPMPFNDVMSFIYSA